MTGGWRGIIRTIRGEGVAGSRRFFLPSMQRFARQSIELGRGCDDTNEDRTCCVKRFWL
jgi:hypothetical protein